MREDEALERRIPERAYVVLLDAGGRELSLGGVRRVGSRSAGRPAATSCFVIGGAVRDELERRDTSSRSAR